MIDSLGPKVDRQKCGCGEFKIQKIRFVPAFTYQSLQQGTIVSPPPRIHPKRRMPLATTLFRYYFKRGDIPLCVSHSKSTSKSTNGKRLKVKWLCDPIKLDYCYYLPIIIDGLGDSDKHLRELATNAAYDLIIQCPKKVLPVVPQIILPLKKALNTRDPPIIIGVLKMIQELVSIDPFVGQCLVPFFRTLLPICNLFREVNTNLGQYIDRQTENCLGDVIEKTLQMLERFGGPNAYINIKYMIPTYETTPL